MRGHYHVNKADDNRKNIFYYTGESRKMIKRFKAAIDKNIPIYFKNGDEIEFIYSGELTE
jgi:hypothetical protein